MPNRPAFTSIDEYIATFPPEVRVVLNELRALIARIVPDAIETISYSIPTFDLQGHLVHFAAFKNHIGFYPTPSAIAAFKTELAEYRTAKGSVQFPLGKALPVDLIQRMVEFRVNENLSQAR